MYRCTEFGVSNSKFHTLGRSHLYDVPLPPFSGMRILHLVATATTIVVARFVSFMVRVRGLDGRPALAGAAVIASLSNNAALGARLVFRAGRLVFCD